MKKYSNQIRWGMAVTGRTAHTVQIRWGIVGTGRIAHTFAKALSGCEGMELYAVASRTAEKAADFANNSDF